MLQRGGKQSKAPSQTNHCLGVVGNRAHPMPRLQVPPTLSSHPSDPDPGKWPEPGMRLCFRQAAHAAPSYSRCFKAHGDSAWGESEQDVTERRQQRLTQDSGKQGGPGF